MENNMENNKYCSEELNHDLEESKIFQDGYSTSSKISTDENTDMNNPYESLKEVFQQAYNQASSGKGKERHSYGDNEPYEKQLICSISRRLQNPLIAGPCFQVCKKTLEAGRLDPDAAIRELLGAINYAAAAIILLQEEKIKNQK